MNTNGLIRKMQDHLRNPPDPSKLFEYQRRIKRLQLKPAQMESLWDLIVSRFTFFPTVSEVLECANELRQLDARDRRDTHWLLFDHDGVRWCMPCCDPSHPPELPNDASNAHLVVDRPVDARDYEPCSLDKGRDAFRQGYMDAGGDPRQLRDIMRALENKAKPLALPEPEPVAVADYDDDIPF